MATNRRLFVGGLSESTDEYSLVQFLSKHGKIAKFDYLFHKSGPKRGKPRGYAFVEYSKPDEAVKTLLELHDKPLHGRKVSIKWANEAPPMSNDRDGRSHGTWRSNAATHRPSTLSLLKGHNKPESRDTKISALEKKLALMEAERASSAGPSASEGEGDGENDAKPSSSSAPKPKALEKPSTLPAKPAAATIREGEMLEAKEEREKEMGGSNRRHGAKAKEAPRPSTLVGLNASMRD